MAQGEKHIPSLPLHNVSRQCAADEITHLLYFCSEILQPRVQEVPEDEIFFVRQRDGRGLNDLVPVSLWLVV